MPGQLKPIDRVGARRSIPGGVKQKYFLTPQGRQLILDRYDGSTERITELQKALNVPREKVKQWAYEMGLTRSVERWTKEEVDFLKKNIRNMTLVEISNYLHKKVHTIRRKSHKLGLWKEEREEYTLSDVAMGFGVNHNTIRRWVEKGWLKGEKGKSQFSFETWQFAEKDIRSFIRDCPDLLNPQKFDWAWIHGLCFDVSRLDKGNYTDRTR